VKIVVGIKCRFERYDVEVLSELRHRALKCSVLAWKVIQDAEDPAFQAESIDLSGGC
jgi:hypothetical protein